MVWRATTDPLAGRMRPAGRVFEDAGLTYGVVPMDTKACGVLG
jgi:hypothetical protein